MEQQSPRGSHLAARERYLWLWRQVLLLDQRIQQLFAKPASIDKPSPRQLWMDRLKIQLRRYWP